jgi:hypothetical protein
MKQMNQRDAIHYIASRQEFKASALEGRAGGSLSPSNRLSEAEANQFIRTEGIGYTVYSYDTPIAWHTEAHGWHLVEQKFSSTTSKHQNYVRRAVAQSLELAL